MFYKAVKENDGTYSIRQSKAGCNYEVVLLGVRGCNVNRVINTLRAKDDEKCPHYEDNQGFCHRCGILMNEELAYLSGYHPNQRGMADKFDDPPEFDVAGGL